MRIIRFFLTIFLIFPAGSVAQENKPTVFGEALDLLFKSPDVELSNIEKITVARGFEQVCGEMERRIPTLSPKEENWVESEIAANRIESLFGSEEFAKRQSKRTLRDCYLFSSGIRKAIESYGDKQPEIKYEARLWLHLLTATTDWNLKSHLDNLVSRRVPQITQKDANAVSLCDMSSSLIIRKILIPMMGKL